MTTKPILESKSSIKSGRNSIKEQAPMISRQREACKESTTTHKKSIEWSSWFKNLALHALPCQGPSTVIVS